MLPESAVTRYTIADARSGTGPLWNLDATDIARVGRSLWLNGLKTVAGICQLDNTEMQFVESD